MKTPFLNFQRKVFNFLVAKKSDKKSFCRLRFCADSCQVSNYFVGLNIRYFFVEVTWYKSFFKTEAK